MLILSWFKERFLSNTSYHSWVTRSATVAFLPSASVEPTHSLRSGVRQHCCTLGAFSHVCVCVRDERDGLLISITCIHKLTSTPNSLIGMWSDPSMFHSSYQTPSSLRHSAPRLSISLSVGFEGVGISGGSAEENGGQSCSSSPKKALSLAQGGLCWYLDLSTRDYISHWNYHYHVALPWGLPSSSLLWG